MADPSCPNALILGGAVCLWKDLQALGPWDGVIIGINRAGAVYPYRIDHFVTAHPERLPIWRSERRARGGNDDFTVWSIPDRMTMIGVDRIVPNWGGSSGLVAVRVAIEIGSPRIVLAGVPMDPQSHFDRPGDWVAAEGFRSHWERWLPKMRGRVRSLSGWTCELLGYPTPEWIAGHDACAEMTG